MTDRERLLQILSVPIYTRMDVDPLEALADFLLDNGVTFATTDYGWPIFGESIRVNKGTIEDAKRIMLDNLCYAVKNIAEQYDCIIVNTDNGGTSVGWKIALPIGFNNKEG